GHAMRGSPFVRPRHESSLSPCRARMARSMDAIVHSFGGGPALTRVRECQLQTTRGRSDVSPQGPRIARRATASQLYERPPNSWEAVFVPALTCAKCGRSLMVKPWPSKPMTRVRFPPPALARFVGKRLDRARRRLELS